MMGLAKIELGSPISDIRFVLLLPLGVVHTAGSTAGFVIIGAGRFVASILRPPVVGAGLSVWQLSGSDLTNCGASTGGAGSAFTYGALFCVWGDAEVSSLYVYMAYKVGL